MILIFLGSWRSTVIIAVSIPLSILTSIIVLSALGETINIMTLGGLALAVGILVDDATVEIENINRNIAEGKEIQKAILDGAPQIAVPAFVSTLRHLHCFCSDVLSDWRRPLPVCSPGGSRRVRHAGVLSAVADAGADHGEVSASRPRGRSPGHLEYQSRNPLVRLQVRFEHGLRTIARTLHEMVANAASIPSGAWLMGFCDRLGLALSFLLVPWLGQDFFPKVDAGQIQAAPQGAHRNANRRDGKSL